MPSRVGAVTFSFSFLTFRLFWISTPVRCLALTSDGQFLASAVQDSFIDIVSVYCIYCLSI